MSELSLTHKDQSFLVPVDEIRANDYDLSINKYKDVERVKVEYEKPETIMHRIKGLEKEINIALPELEKMM